MNDLNRDAKTNSIKGQNKKERRALKIAAQEKTKISKGRKDNSDCMENADLETTKPKNKIVTYSGNIDDIKLSKISEDTAGSFSEKNVDRNKNYPNSNKSDNSKITPNEGKSKAQLKAERRKLQEKQRQIKANLKEKKKDIQSDLIKTTDAKMLATNIKRCPAAAAGQVELFNHLQFKSIANKNYGFSDSIHPSFIQLGTLYAARTILGSNARCLALLATLKRLINDFTTPFKQELCRSFETYLQVNVNYLQKCRPFAVSMTNALRHFKVHSTQIKTDLNDTDKKASLLRIIATYVEDEIFTAGKAISLKVSEKIVNGDKILIFGSSSLIRKILVDAHGEGKFFKVTIIDSRPLFEGREMLRQLVSAGIDCEYTLINAVSFLMGEATKVLLGAHALLANGYVMARNGTAQIALVAQSFNKPVLVCCETYKFSERVQTDSFVYNEIGNSDVTSTLNSQLDEINLRNSNITRLNLMYDVTPPNLVTAVVTELGFLPCTSVPVILRIKPTE